MLATIDVDTVSATNAEVLEKVVRKLRARAMPPRGMPRPDEAVYQSFVSHLETSLDRFAAANPNPGRPDTLRRLNRTEYQNAVRDLLDLEADVAAILPSDDSAAWVRQHQRRRAVADAAGALPGGLAEDQPSRRRYTGPFPRRGNGGAAAGSDTGRLFRRTAVRHACGCDRAATSFRSMASTVFRLHLTRDRDERIEGLTEPHQIEVSIDGERLQLFTVNPMRSVRVADRGPRTIRGQRAGRRRSRRPRGGEGRTARGAGSVPQEVFGFERNRSSACIRRASTRTGIRAGSRRCIAEEVVGAD